MAAKMEITLSSQSHIQASSKPERHIITKLEDKRGPTLQKDRPDPELSRQSFRRFCYQEVSGPQEALSRLQQLCRQWLQPELHTKEQILELLVLEQFLNILPPEIQARIRHRCPVSSKEIVTLVEDFQRAAKRPKQWVRRALFRGHQDFFHLDGIWSLHPSLFSQSPEMDPMTANVASGLYLGTPLGDVNRFLENLGTSTPVRK